MKYLSHLKTGIIVSSALLLSACSKSGSNPTPQPPALSVTSLSANSGPFNTTVVITGTGFDAAKANDQVFFNNKAATITAATTTQLTATVPVGAGTGNVTVSVNNGTPVSGPVFTYQLSAVVSTFAGSAQSGSANGKGASASFSNLWGVAFDPSGNLYVTDSYMLRKITPDGTVSFVAGNVNALGKDGQGASASFEQPASIVADGAGNFYIADIQAIRKVTPDGTVSTIASSFSIENGMADYTGVVLDASGNLFACDVQNNVIVKIASDETASIFAGSGAQSSVDGKGTAASFSKPVGMCIDKSGNIFVLDEKSNKIRKITPDGTVTTVAGSGAKGAADGPGMSASFNDPTGIIVDAAGNLYVGDFYNFTIRKITPDGTVSTIAGSGTQGVVDGAGKNAEFLSPNDLVMDASGNIYVADGFAVREITFQ